MGKGTELWNKAKKIIPGGNQLLSKRSEMFLPDFWPSYYQKAKGVDVWDLDGRHYVDMSIMGIGSCVLGYGYRKVDQAVRKAIEKGSMCTLNCYEEVKLAEKLIAMHSWAGMVRFARTGGEACAVAVRIARAYSGKDKVLFCGYHGWHDWYLPTNLANDKHLDGQLLPGLDPAGVPRELKGTAIPFMYGDIDQLKGLLEKNKGSVGVIIMEVARNKGVNIPFLKEIRKICSEQGIVLIFDEVSSGFRVNIGGMHMLYNVLPDIVILGKALGNGYPIAAVIGRKEVMEAAQSTFISSTFWTERVGFSAALEAINQFEKNDVIKHITEIGSYIMAGWRKIFDLNKLNIEIVGLPSVPIMVIKEAKELAIKTLFTQEMLKRDFLASTIVYVSYAHTKKIVDAYLKEAKKVFDLIVLGIKKNNLDNLLDGPVCHTGFKRLT